MERRRRSARLEPLEPMTKTVRRRDKPRERWLLTRKTWKYMSDAGRRLIPDGAQNRAEDVPRIEAYFQEVCGRESRFLLWRKSSYPGALPRPRRKKRARGGSVRARSPSDDPPPPRPTDLYIPHISGGRFDIAKARRDFFATPAAPAVLAPPVDDDESTLADLLRKYLKLEDDKGPSRLSESDELVLALKRYLKRQADRAPSDSDADPTTQRSLLENLGRYYGRSPNRDNIVQDLLTDRNLLKRLYHDLRKTKPYRGSRNGGGGAGYPGSSFGAGVGRGGSRLRIGAGRGTAGEVTSPPLSPPPLIELESESAEEPGIERGTQTLPIPEEVLAELERAYRETLEGAASPTSPGSPPTDRRPRRRSSVDHDDVSESVSDKISRYLRMARKKSVDADKADRFKRINYDKNLRNIKPRTPGEVDDDGLSKGCQTEEGWILSYRELGSPVSPPASPSFLGSLLGRGSTVGGGAGGMQKSRSSSSVVQSVSKRLWRTRSRSSSRAAPAWTPQGSCLWSDGSGRCVRLGPCSLLALSEVERRALQQAALARLHQINLGTTVTVPDENTTVQSSKPKRRAYLLKRKALTTGFFDQRSTKDVDKDKDSTGSGSIFGVALAQCVETERALRRQQHGGSRSSLASLTNHEKGDDSESCDSGEWNWSGLEEAGGGGPKVPALVSACLAHLRRHGLRKIGLFRVSASKKRVRQLREEWERGQEAALDAAVCPHDVATLLKEFLRDLPDPLLCRELYPAFLQTQKIRNRRLQWEALRLIVQLLPAAHRDTLNALLSFLSELASHSDDDQEPGNKMDAANLATIFAPNILHRNKPNEAASAEQLSERVDVINVVRQLIERQHELWTVAGDVLHEAYIHLAHSAPAHLDSLLLRRADASVERSSEPAPAARVTHTQAPHAQRRARDAASDTSSGSFSSAMTIVTSRVRSSVEECGSSGVVCADSAADSNDSSDYNETLGNSDEDSCVITASLHIPFPSRPARTPRRRSSGSESSHKRDSAVGSSASTASSPPASAPRSPPPASPPPPVTPLRVTLTSAGELRRPADIDKILSLGKERNTSDARAVMLRQHDDTTQVSRHSRLSSRHETTKKEEVQRREVHRSEEVHRREDLYKREDVTRREESNSRREQTSRREQSTVRREEKKEGPTLYKRGELISSARPHPT